MILLINMGARSVNTVGAVGPFSTTALFQLLNNVPACPWAKALGVNAGAIHNSAMVAKAAKGGHSRRERPRLTGERD
jgi:hypothetical protein